MDKIENLDLHTLHYATCMRQTCRPNTLFIPSI